MINLTIHFNLVAAAVNAAEEYVRMLIIFGPALWIGLSAFVDQVSEEK